MRKLLAAAFIIAAMLAVSSAQAQPTSAPTGPAAPAAAPAAGGLPAVTHLVYQFGYNQRAASSGNNTGKTTIDIVGLAGDGGMTVTATDEWWHAVHPKQSNTCEVYPNGGVTCAKAPYSLTGIQTAIVPLLGQQYFSALSQSLTATWKQNYTMRMTFAPGVGRGFAGQVYTWNCAYTLTGKGTLAEQPPLITVHLDGSMKQQGGRYIQMNQQANILYDPRIHMPVFVNELMRFVPQTTTASYSVDLSLIKYK